MKAEHDWKQTGWEYDDNFYTCRRCHRTTNCRRGAPASTEEQCREADVEPCISMSER